MFNPVWAMISDFQRQYLHVQVFCDASRKVMDLIEDEIDVAIRIQMSQNLPDNVIVKRLMMGGTKTIAPRELIAQYGIPKTPDDLLKMPCIGWTFKGNQLTWQFGTQTVRPNAIFATNDLPMLYFVAQQRQAVCQIADYLADEPDCRTGFCASVS